MTEFDPLSPIDIDTAEDETEQPITVAAAALLWILTLVVLACAPAVVIAVWGRLL